jgi:hypothetical protein
MDSIEARAEEAQEVPEPLIDYIDPKSAWAREARRRYEEIRAGRRRTIGNDEVFARLRARFG